MPDSEQAKVNTQQATRALIFDIIRILITHKLQEEPIYKALIHGAGVSPQNISGHALTVSSKPIKYFRRLLAEYELENDIPVPLLKLARYFLSNPDFTKTVGIFRVNSTESEEEDIEGMLSLKNYDKLSEIKNPFVIASNKNDCISESANLIIDSIRKFFRELRSSLISEERFEALVELKRKSTTIECVI